jgi:hypothetical protein
MNETLKNYSNILQDNLVAYITKKHKKKLFEALKNNPNLDFEVISINEYIVLSSSVDENFWGDHFMASDFEPYNEKDFYLNKIKELENENIDLKKQLVNKLKPIYEEFNLKKHFNDFIENNIVISCDKQSVLNFFKIMEAFKMKWIDNSEMSLLNFKDDISEIEENIVFSYEIFSGYNGLRWGTLDEYENDYHNLKNKNKQFKIVEFKGK